jgi:hypothetical protein
MDHRIRTEARIPRLFIALLLTALVSGAAPTSTSTFTTSTTPTLRINEVLASNPNNRNGTTSDLIELFNAGTTAINLAGKSLTDDPAAVQKYVFPAGTTIAAGGYLVVFADTNASTAQQLHTGFALDAEGDQVLLFDANSSVPSDSIKFGFQAPDISISRTAAAANVWALTTPTLGSANGNAVALGALSTVKINEWAGNIVFRLDHDMIELYNPANQPVPIGGVRLTDDVAPGKGYVFPPLSFIPPAPGGYLPLYKGDYLFGLNGDRAVVTLLGENNEAIDQVTVIAQPDDRSAGRNPDGSASIITFNIPTPGLSNLTFFPPAYQALLDNLRITEVMYDPVADNNASQFEFIELQNIGAATLNLGGVRFTNGIDYEFPAGTLLAPGNFIVVVNDRSSFLSRYPAAAGVMAPGGFNGSLANDGETIALTLPAPWKVHILRFRYETTWVPSTSRGGYSLVPVAPATARPQDWQLRSAWRASAAVNGSPGVADPGTGVGVSGTARISNLSILTSVASAGDAFTMGYVVSGASASVTKPILIRAAGPTLGAAPFNISGVLADPRLELFAGSTSAGGNDNWLGTAALSAAFTAVGAFPYVSATSLDAAVLATISARDNSVRVSATGNGTGVVIAELYDSTPIANMTATTPRLVNVSVLKHLGTSLTTGFVIDGTGSKKVLIRAVGPTIGAAPFNVPGTVADPQLTLFSGQMSIGTNDNWGGTAELSAAFISVGAFALPAASRDAALVATLNPGSYTVVVTGVGGTTGVALVEVYEMP